MSNQSATDGRVLRRTLRGLRRRRLLTERMGQAHTASERVGIAAGYLRSALEKAPREVADLTAASAVELLVRQADELYREIRRRRTS